MYIIVNNIFLSITRMFHRHSDLFSHYFYNYYDPIQTIMIYLSIIIIIYLLFYSWMWILRSFFWGRERWRVCMCVCVCAWVPVYVCDATTI